MSTTLMLAHDMTGDGRIHVAWSGCVDVDWMTLSLMVANGAHVLGSPFRLRNVSWFSDSMILGSLTAVRGAYIHTAHSPSLNVVLGFCLVLHKPVAIS